jgi:hypothetical protein
MCEDMIKARAHKGGVRIGKTPKKLASICCSQRRETKADTGLFSVKTPCFLTLTSRTCKTVNLRKDVLKNESVF